MRAYPRRSSPGGRRHANPSRHRLGAARARARRLAQAALAGLLVGAPVLAQSSISPVWPDCGFLVDTLLEVDVSGITDDATIVWGDGAEDDITSDGTYGHVYADAGEYDIVLVDTATQEELDRASNIKVYEYSLTPDTPDAAIDEQVMVTVGADPDSFLLGDGGIIDWDDGSDPSDARDVGSYPHTYEAPGSYTPELTISFEPSCSFATTTIDVHAPTLTPSTTAPRIDESVDLGIDFEPVGGDIDWGDGTTDHLTGAGSYAHAYRNEGAYQVEVRDDDGIRRADATLSVPQPRLTLTPTAAGIGEEIDADIEDGPANGQLDWGDGDTVTGLGSDEQLRHAYDAAGSYRVTLSRQGGEEVAAASVGIDAPSFSVEPGDANVGEEVTATVSNEPSGGSIAWGDGDVTDLDGGGAYLHTYDAAGSYLVELRDAGGTTLLSGSVDVVAPSITLTPARARLSEPVTATVALVGSGSVDWGDGATSVVSAASPTAQHRYADAGTYTVELLVESAVLAAEDATVLEPALTLDTTEPALGTEVLATVGDPPVDATLEWGDGQEEDASAAGTYPHTYRTPGSYEVALIDEHQGRSVQTRTVVVSDADETVAIEDVRYDTVAGEIEVDLLLSGLVPGFDYHVTGAGLFVSFLEAGATERATSTLFRSGSTTLELHRGAVRGDPRDTVALDLAWPRAQEQIERRPSGPVHTGHLVRFDLSGLDPGYRYVLDPGDGTPFDWSYYVEGATAATVEHVYATAGTHEASLYAAYPREVSDAEDILVQGELRSTETVTARAPSGELAFASNEVPYGLPTELELTELTDGATYRVHLGDGTTRTIVAAGATDTLTHTYTELPNDPTLELYDDGFNVWDVIDSADAPRGLTITGSVAPSGGGTALGDEQSFAASGLAPGESYRLAVRRGDASIVSATAVSASDGTASFTVTVPPSAREAETITEMTAELYLVLSGSDLYAARSRFALPPTQRTLNGYVVEVTSLRAPFTRDQWPDAFRADGQVRNMALAGKAQGDVPFELRGPYEARMTGQLALQVPARLSGLSLTFTDLVLAADVAGHRPGFAGRGRLAGQAFTFSSDGWTPGFEGRSSIATAAFRRGEGLLIPALHDATFQVGSSGWEIRAADGASGAFVIDLSQTTGMTYPARDDSYGSRLEEAYAGWEEVSRTPSVDPDAAAWRGVQFLYNNVLVSTTGGPRRETPAIAWTSSGFQATHPATAGADDDTVTYRDWTVDIVSRGSLAIVDSVQVREARAIGALALPFFGKHLLTTVRVNAAGYASLTPLAMPVATDYGETVMVADQARFDVYGNLVFDRAAWALSEVYASDPQSLPSITVAHAIRRALDPNLDVSLLADPYPSELEASLAAIDGAAGGLRLQLPFNGLTLTADGDVRVNGDTWSTLASTPELDVHGFPYMSSGDAAVGVKRDGDEYAIGLRGQIALGGIAKAEVAPLWYYHREGAEDRWRFEGVSVGYGDPTGGISQKVSFGITAGGTVPLSGGSGFELSGSGSLSVELSSTKSISVEVVGVFGMNDQGGGAPIPYWFVLAALDLNPPIYVTAQGADVLAFYAFRGGVGHNLQLDLATGSDDQCAVDDGAGWTADARPSLAKNALDCFDDSNDFAFQAGTLIGWPARGSSHLYGFVWHVDANLVVNSSGSVILGGSGWTMKNLNFGYGRGVDPEMRARLAINDSGIVGSLCVGQVSAMIGDLDCSTLQPLRYEVAGVTLVEVEATAELRASWEGGEGYLALGRYDDPIDLYVIPDRTRGFFVAGRVESPGVLGRSVEVIDWQEWDGESLPFPTRTIYPTGSGIWASMEVGKSWRWSDSFDAGVCTVTASARAYYSFGGRFELEFDPEQFLASASASAGASASLRGCELDTSVGVSLSARGTIEAPSPFRFTGEVTASADLPVIGDVEATIPDVTISL